MGEVRVLGVHDVCKDGAIAGEKIEAQDTDSVVADMGRRSVGYVLQVGDGCGDSSANHSK